MGQALQGNPVAATEHEALRLTYLGTGATVGALGNLKDVLTTAIESSPAGQLWDDGKSLVQNGSLPETPSLGTFASNVWDSAKNLASMVGSIISNTVQGGPQWDLYDVYLQGQGQGKIAVDVATLLVGSEVLAGKGAATTRGLGQYGGVFTSSTNEAGGVVWTSTGTISQNDFTSLVNGGLYKGDVNIITGVHGLPDGTTLVDSSLYRADLKEFRNIPGVNIYNFPDLTPMQIKSLLNGPGTTIGGFCNSGVCLVPYK
jgi:hypothetical protein